MGGQRCHGGHPYLDHREHALVGLRVGVNFEALPRISVDDGVRGPPCSCCGVIFVLYGQIDNNSHGSFLHRGLELQAKQEAIVSVLKFIWQAPVTELFLCALHEI